MAHGHWISCATNTCCHSKPREAVAEKAVQRARSVATGPATSQDTSSSSVEISSRAVQRFFGGKRSLWKQWIDGYLYSWHRLVVCLILENGECYFRFKYCWFEKLSILTYNLENDAYVSSLWLWPQLSKFNNKCAQAKMIDNKIHNKMFKTNTYVDFFLMRNNFLSKTKNWNIIGKASKTKTLYYY